MLRGDGRVVCPKDFLADLLQDERILRILQHGVGLGLLIQLLLTRERIIAANVLRRGRLEDLACCCILGEIVR